MLFARTYPLRLVIILPFSFLFFMAAAVFSIVSYQNSETLARSMGHSFAQELARRIEQYVESLTEVMPAITDINANALLSGNLSAVNPAQNTPWLLSQLRQHQQLSFVSIAYADGRYIAASRPPNTPDQIEIASNVLNPDRHLIGYLPNASNHIGAQKARIQGTYDPRKRPFVQCAIADPKQPCWGSIYRYLDSDNYGISMSRAVVDEHGRLIAVVAADIALNRLNQFMAKLDVGYHGLAFLANRQNGQLIASSNVALLPVNAADGGRYRIDNHPSNLLKNLPPLKQASHTPAEFDVNGTPYLLETINITLGYQKSWQLVVLVPVDNIAAPIIAQVRDTLLVTSISLLLLIFIGAGLARKIAHPIENIAKLASRNTLTEIAHYQAEEGQIVEVDHLTSSLANLASAQLNSIQMLEQQVHHRTLELQQANDQLRKLSELDPLTGIANRRVFSNYLEQAWLDAINAQQPLSMILCDIDLFKSYNDHYGHQAGDAALKLVAHHLQTHLHVEKGLVARYGGEEFALVLPNFTVEQAGELAEQLRQTLVEKAFERADTELMYLTLSLGYACVYPQQTEDAQQLVKQADEQLYIAKNNGRNQVQPQLS